MGEETVRSTQDVKVKVIVMTKWEVVVYPRGTGAYLPGYYRQLSCTLSGRLVFEPPRPVELMHRDVDLAPYASAIQTLAESEVRKQWRRRYAQEQDA